MLQHKLFLVHKSTCLLGKEILYKAKYKENKILMPDKKNKLRAPAIVKTDNLYHIKKQHILKRAGKVDKKLVEEYLRLYYTWQEEKVPA